MPAVGLRCRDRANEPANDTPAKPAKQRSTTAIWATSAQVRKAANRTADAHGSGPCVRKDVRVQIPPRPLYRWPAETRASFVFPGLPGGTGFTFANKIANGISLGTMRKPRGHIRPHGAGYEVAVPISQ